MSDDQPASPEPAPLAETPQIPVSEALSESIPQPSEPVPAAIPEPIVEVSAPEPAPQNTAPSEQAKPSVEQAGSGQAVSETVQETAPASAPAKPVQSEPLEIPEVATPTSQSKAASAAQSSTPQTPVPVVAASAQAARALLVKARAKIQTKKQQKLEKIMTLFEKKQKITNDDVEKLLHVSDATALRYLNQLVKQGKIQRVGRTGAGVEYTKI